MRIFGQLAVAATLAGAGEPMRILDDQAVMRCLPRKHLFENIDDKLMRNAAGTIYYGC